jgi:hypothetical protein
MKISSMEDWYRTSIKQIERLAPITLFENYSLAQLLTEAYPSYPWDLSKLFKRGPNKSSQRMLYLTVKEIIPNTGD